MGVVSDFSGKLEKKITDDQWVLSLIEEGYKLEFIQKPPQSGMKETIVPRKNLDIFKCRSGRIVKKRCYRKSTSKREGMRFLQHLLSSSQEERENETSNKFETPKQVSEERTFQNGHIEKSQKPGETKQLGYFSGSGRCISTHTNISESQEISPFLHSRTMLAMEMPMLRSFDRASGIFQSNFSDCSTFKGSEYQTSVLSRRLVGSESTKKAVVAR